MRVYLPATLPLLRQWLLAGAAEPPGPAYAVTPAVREWYREGDLDELEHVAQLVAAADALRLLAEDPAAPRRRVVLAADVEDLAARPQPDVDRAAMRLSGAVPLVRWASALVDDPGAAAVVATAITAMPVAAAAGDDDARFELDEAAAYELGWYAVQELEQLLGD